MQPLDLAECRGMAEEESLISSTCLGFGMSSTHMQKILLNSRQIQFLEVEFAYALLDKVKVIHWKVNGEVNFGKAKWAGKAIM